MTGPWLLSNKPATTRATIQPMVRLDEIFKKPSAAQHTHTKVKRLFVESTLVLLLKLEFGFGPARVENRTNRNNNWYSLFASEWLSFDRGVGLAIYGSGEASIFDSRCLADCVGGGRYSG